MILLALAQMTPGVAAVFYLIAFVAFVVVMLTGWAERWPKISFLGLGLAAFVFPFLWNAVAAA